MREKSDTTMTSLSMNRRILFLTATWIAIGSIVLSGQTNPTQNSASSQPTNINSKPLAFDVVSIKRNKSGSPSGNLGFKPDGIYSTNMALSSFLSNGLHGQQVYGAPDWLQVDRYDFEAKVAASDLTAYHKLSGVERDIMLHAVFEDRLKLKDHKEVRELPIYALVIAKGGPKFNEAPPEKAEELKPPPGSIHVGEGLFLIRDETPGERHVIGQGAPIDGLVNGFLSYARGIDRLVVNKTGLTGKYDFTLNWRSSDQADTTAPSIFTAIQEQLGLKLESTKGPVEVLVIDHIERPTEN
jgi:uncharacterized protein (TIGR03435 family)